MNLKKPVVTGTWPNTNSRWVVRCLHSPLFLNFSPCGIVLLKYIVPLKLGM